MAAEEVVVRGGVGFEVGFPSLKKQLEGEKKRPKCDAKKERKNETKNRRKSQLLLWET